jgi:transposase
MAVAPVTETKVFTLICSHTHPMKKKQPAGKTRRNKSNKKPSTKQHSINPRTHPDAAGIDISAQEFVVAVAPDRCEVPVRTFPTFTSGVHALRDWLVSCGIKTVAMESTSNYWIMLYDTLVAAGIDVYLVNARHVKGVPGRKTDVCDSQWLQQLHAAGLLRKSFRPALEIVPLRYLMRHRGELVGDMAKHLQLMQKVLTEMNLKLQHVFSDIDGVSAQAIIDAILSGERDVSKLASLRDRRCQRKQEDVEEALRGDYREEYLLVLKQSRDTHLHLQSQLAQLDAKIADLVSKVRCEVSAPLPEAPKAQHKENKNTPKIGVFAAAWRFYGVDLSAVPGISAAVLCALMSEVGTRAQFLAAFPTAAHFASWLGLCPDNRISGGKVLKANTRKVQSRLARALRLGVFGLNRSETQMGLYVGRMKSRLGKAEGITAGAHKLARVIHGMIKNQTAYNEAEAFKITPLSRRRRERALAQKAAALGYELLPKAA